MTLDEAINAAEAQLRECDSSDIHFIEIVETRYPLADAYGLEDDLVPEQPEPSQLSINLQIHLSPDASEAQIESVIRYMQKHLNPRSDWSESGQRQDRADRIPAEQGMTRKREPDVADARYPGQPTLPLRRQDRGNARPSIVQWYLLFDAAPETAMISR